MSRAVVTCPVWILLVAACTAGGPAARTTPPAPSPTVASPVPRPTHTSPGPSFLRCDDSIGTLESPTAGTRVILGVVALPTEFLQVVALPDGRLWSKRGLEVRAGAVVEISVAPEASRHATIGWGSPGRPGSTQRVNGCSALGCIGRCEWLAFAGGYWVDAPACVPLVIRSAGREARVGVAVGARCQ